MACSRLRTAASSSSAGRRASCWTTSDFYDYDYSDYYATGSYSVTFGGENKLTAAIYRVTSGESSTPTTPPTTASRRLTDTLTDALEGQNLSV